MSSYMTLFILLFLYISNTFHAASDEEYEGYLYIDDIAVKGYHDVWSDNSRWQITSIIDMMNGKKVQQKCDSQNICLCKYIFRHSSYSLYYCSFNDAKKSSAMFSNAATAYYDNHMDIVEEESGEKVHYVSPRHKENIIDGEAKSMCKPLNTHLCWGTKTHKKGYICCKDSSECSVNFRGTPHCITVIKPDEKETKVALSRKTVTVYRVEAITGGNAKLEITKDGSITWNKAGSGIDINFGYPAHAMYFLIRRVMQGHIDDAIKSFEADPEAFDDIFRLIVEEKQGSLGKVEDWTMTGGEMVLFGLTNAAFNKYVWEKHILGTGKMSIPYIAIGDVVNLYKLLYSKNLKSFKQTRKRKMMSNEDKLEEILTGERRNGWSKLVGKDEFSKYIDVYNNKYHSKVPGIDWTQFKDAVAAVTDFSLL